MNAVQLSIFSSRITALCDEMGAVLRRAAFSPNIKDRLDFSCALFDAQGQLCAQAAHIPVHLGSMAYAMADLVKARDWRPGDMLVLNDPYRGGTHLPDITLIAPIFIGQQCLGFVANRAHHADIGADSPGSMPIGRCLQDEGLLIAPTLLLEDDAVQSAVLDDIIAATHSPVITQGDFSAQISANRAGVKRALALIEGLGPTAYLQGLMEINAYGERMAQAAFRQLPDGDYRFEDVMDDDGQGHHDIPLQVCVSIRDHRVNVDFSGSATQVDGNINCPLSVAAAAVFYVFRCLMDERTPACAGSFRSIEISAPAGCLVNALPPAAVAAGNVETSSRIVDLVSGALAKAVPDRVAAASQGTMNNLALGARGRGGAWDYYETLAGGMGAGRYGGGLHAVQTHMTNTMNTPIEVLEAAYPMRIRRYAIRRGSGGVGQRTGGDGLIRVYEFLAPAQATLLTERRGHSPWGLLGGRPGQPGLNCLNGAPLPAKVALSLKPGDRLEIQTPGGGGFSTPSAE
jgi:N-methylhydantoinase B